MRKVAGVAIVMAGLLGGCGYLSTPPDPIRVTDIPADVFACRRLAPVGQARIARPTGAQVALNSTPPAARLGQPARTDGQAPAFFRPGSQAFLDSPEPALGSRGGYGVIWTNPGGAFAVRLDALEAQALALGATDLLLTRRSGRDWSYVSGTAYRCRT